MISLTKSQRGVLGAVAVMALLAGCAQPSPVSPAIVNAPPPPPRPAFPSDESLGTQSGTFTALPDPVDLSQGQTGLTGTGTLVVGAKKYRFAASGMTASGFGNTVSPISGEVFDLTTPASFAGTYTLTAVSDDHKEAVLTNEKGVKIKMSSMRPMKSGLQSVTVRLTR